jgi:hypothetical protein
LVDFERFRLVLERAVPRSDGAKGGRPAFGHMLMFKVLLLQAMHALSDERAEYLIKDRLSFMRFLGLHLGDPVPGANTIWTFREALKRAGAGDTVFAQFDAMLRPAGYLAMGGQIVDASIVAAPRQRNTEAGKAAIKAGLFGYEMVPAARVTGNMHAKLANVRTEICKLACTARASKYSELPRIANDQLKPRLDQHAHLRNQSD